MFDVVYSLTDAYYVGIFMIYLVIWLLIELIEDLHIQQVYGIVIF